MRGSAARSARAGGGFVSLDSGATTERRSWAFTAGAVLQGLTLGLLTLWALLELAASASGGNVFRYQGF